jgi:hypothetical protein
MAPPASCFFCFFLKNDIERRKRKKIDGMEDGQCFYLNESERHNHKGKCTIRTALVQY